MNLLAMAKVSFSKNSEDHRRGFEHDNDLIESRVNT
jgi:hypothetical protein